MIKKLLLSIVLASPLYADQVAVSNFKYLNSNVNSTIIDNSEAQDLLNVDITPGGKSIKKRPGYGLYKQVFTTSSGIHGGYHGFDSTGNDVQIWASSVSVKGIVGDATPTTIISSMSVNSTIDCADTQGSMYCVDSSRDFYIRTNGATLTNWYTSPLGTMVEATPDRVVVAGVAASPNTLFVSQSNTFTNFVTGPLATDAFNEAIAAPGSRITHIRWGCQKLLWWKDQSFGYFDFDDQYTAQVKIVSDNIGTYDNTSAIDPGGTVWFRGQDGHIYSYDCSGLAKQTIEITPQIQALGRRSSNSYTQSTQAEFQTGTIVPTGKLSTTISVNDVVPSSFSALDDVAADWTAGTISSLTVVSGSLKLTYNGLSQMVNPGAESGATGWTSPIGPFTSGLAQVPDCSPTFRSPHSGSVVFEPGNDSHAQTTFGVEIVDMSGNILASTSHNASTLVCNWAQGTVTVNSTDYGKAVQVRMRTTGSYGTRYFVTVSSYILGGNMTYWYMNDTTNVNFDDFAGGLSSVSSGTFTSKSFDTGFVKSYVTLVPSYTASTFSPNFVLQDSSNGSTFTEVGTSTSTGYSVNRYVRYISSFTPAANLNANTTLDSVTVVARSSGTFYSPVINKPNITTWDILSANISNNGGSHVFYMRSSSNSFTSLSSTPAWTSQSTGNSIAISTAVYFQLRDDFVLTTGTSVPTLSDYTINWFEGGASDQAYMLYFDNAIWASVTYGVGVSSNNYIFRRDLINDGWTLYGFGAGGMLIQGNRLYFGSVPDGNVFQFGTGTSDNGTAINAYWKSKDFTSPDPFLQSSLTQIDIFGKQNTGQSLTSTYTTDTSTATSYTMSLNLPTQGYVQNRKLLPTGKTGYTFNLKLSDSSTTSAWEVFGFRMMYTTLPWKPTQ